MFFSARSNRRSSISTAASVSFGLAHNKRRRSALPTPNSDAASPTLIDPFARFARGENVSNTGGIGATPDGIRTSKFFASDATSSRICGASYLTWSDDRYLRSPDGWSRRIADLADHGLGLRSFP